MVIYKQISITLTEETIAFLESRIDGIKIRSRSHAIEHILSIARERNWL